MKTLLAGLRDVGISKRPGDSLIQFKEELDKLTDQDRIDLAKEIEKVIGEPVDPSIKGKSASSAKA